MNIRKFVTITLLVLSSFAATNVAPTRAELESMYDKAFREFNAANYSQALKELDAIDERQPNLAESQNLRGVILMRQGQYDSAENALQKALATDPKFWNARFNLAEIPFLRKDWTEARKRFDALLQGNASELQGDAAQLIQYKILLTYLLEGNENMVESILAKFELSPETPAANYSNAAIALQHKNEKEAKDLLAVAEKNFSPQLNKLFAESLYEVGWLQKPAGQTRAALELTSPEDQAAKVKALAAEKYDLAEQALQQRDLATARRLVDEADAAEPNQPATINLRGEILLAQKEFDAAEAAFQQAVQLDPKMSNAQFNLAQIPFKKKEYAKARERFEALFGATAGSTGDKNQTAQIIKFNIYLTLLLEGKDSRAQKMMEQFKFTGDTPALYYAQAAWEFKHHNTAKATDWVASARKIYSPALNSVFADSFYDLGWLEMQAPAPASGTQLAKEETAPPDDSNLSAPAKDVSSEPVKETQDLIAQQPPMSASTLGAAAADPEAPPKVEAAIASNALPVEDRTSVSTSPSENSATGSNVPAADAQQKPEEKVSAPVAVASTPATVTAPAAVQKWAQPVGSDRMINSRTILVSALLLAAAVLLAWVVVSEIRRRIGVSAYQSAGSAMGSRFDGAESSPTAEKVSSSNRLAGGPPQVSVQLKASEPSVRRAAVPFGRGGRPGTMGAGVSRGSASTEDTFIATSAEPADDIEQVGEVLPSPVGQGEPVVVPPFHEEPVIVPATFSGVSDLAAAPEWEFSPARTDAIEGSEVSLSTPQETQTFAEMPVMFAPGGLEAPQVPEPVANMATEAIRVQDLAETASDAVETPRSVEETDGFVESVGEPIVIPPEVLAEPIVASAREFSTEEMEPVAQGQPIPYQVPAFSIDSPMAEITKPEIESHPPHLPLEEASGLVDIGPSVESPSFAPQVISTDPLAQQPTTPVTMSQPTQPTAAPAPAIRTAPMTGGATQPQPASGMHTAVQLTFSFEIASMQLTPTFKMGALQLKPTSKIVTMRLAPSQQPQPPMNLQVTFEIATVQLTGNTIGMIRLVPSQQQRPGVISSPSFNIAGLQLLSGVETGAVQITPSQQGQASVHVTGRFQITTVDFSPSFEIASIVLNSTSRNVSVQLPGAGPSAVEGAPIFEIVGVQLGGNGEIGMMQLTSQGAAPKPA